MAVMSKNSHDDEAKALDDEAKAAEKKAKYLQNSLQNGDPGNSDQQKRNKNVSLVLQCTY